MACLRFYWSTSSLVISYQFVSTWWQELTHKILGTAKSILLINIGLFGMFGDTIGVRQSCLQLVLAIFQPTIKSKPCFLFSFRPSAASPLHITSVMSALLSGNLGPATPKNKKDSKFFTECHKKIKYLQNSTVKSAILSNNPSKSNSFSPLTKKIRLYNPCQKVSSHNIELRLIKSFLITLVSLRTFQAKPW